MRLLVGTKAIAGDNFVAENNCIATSLKFIKRLFKVAVAMFAKPLFKLFGFRLALPVAKVTKSDFIIDNCAAIGGKNHVG